MISLNRKLMQMSKFMVKPISYWFHVTYCHNHLKSSACAWIWILESSAYTRLSMVTVYVTETFLFDCNYVIFLFQLNILNKTTRPYETTLVQNENFNFRTCFKLKLFTLTGRKMAHIIIKFWPRVVPILYTNFFHEYI